MRQFVIAISHSAKQQKSTFCVIPQNGIELITGDGDPKGALAADYLAAVDGHGQEDLFYGYDGDDRATSADNTNYLKNYLKRSQQAGNTILVTDYCSTPAHCADEKSVVSLLKKIRRDASHLAELDKSVADLDSRLESAFYELSDVADEFCNYENSLVFDQNRLQQVEDRLSLIYNLKKKYASSINAPLSEVFDYFENAQHYIEENGEGNNYKEKLEGEIKKLEKELLFSAEILSKKRKETAVILNNEVNEILSKLGMNGTKFEVSIKLKSGNNLQQNCGPYGKDDIEFMISANPGNPLLPLAKIASGGELSRVMLALKTIFAQTDSVDTLIFDEIDTGIGGEVAVAVGLHLKNLAKKRQIFCITHLASIAVYADNQIKIEKTVSGEITSSNVHVIEGEERVSEIARMLSGDSDTQQSLEHARLLLSKYSKI